MNDRSDARMVKRVRVFAAAAAVFSVVIGLSVLTGWTFHVANLTNWGAPPTSMVANTATCLMLIGVALWLLRKKDNQAFSWARKVAARTAAAMAGAVGLLSLAEHIFRLDLGLDQFLLATPPAMQSATIRPGLMSPITAVAFLLLSVALMGIDWRTRLVDYPAQWLAVAAGGCASFGVLRFASDPTVYGAHLTLSLPTGVALSVFSMGLLVARTEWGLGALLCSRSLGGSLARRLMLAAFIPVVVGWLCWRFSASGHYSESSVVVLVSLTTLSLMAGLIGWAAVAVDRDDRERRKAEKARDRLAAIVESSDDAIIGKNREGMIIDWNRGAEKVFGYTSAEIVGKSVLILIPPGREEEEPDILAKIAGGASVERFETVRIRKDGQAIDVSVTISPIRDSHGAIIGASIVARDITERKRAQEALHESEERFQAMANGIPQLAWMAEADGSIFWFNQRWYEYTGTTLEQTKGWTWESVHDPAVLPKVLDRWKGAIATGTSFDMEFPLRGADGSFRTFLTRIMPVKDSTGKVVRWFGTHTDIGERKQTEERLALQAQELACSREALERQTRMLQLVLESMGEGLIASDLEGNFLIWNDSAKKLLGQGPADLSTEEWTEHYGCYQDDGMTPVPTERLPLVRAMQGESLQAAQLMIRRPGGEPGIFLEFTGRPMKDDGGNLCGGVVAFRDITERKVREREIQKLNDELEIRVMQRTEQLEAANRELEAFSYSVSHDLRAPLRHISGFSQMLVEEFAATLDPVAKHYLDRIQAGTQEMGLLVDELLNLARVGRHVLRRQSTKCKALVEEVIAMLEPECAGRQVEWVVPELPVMACDPVLVKQVFQNLLANALKFTRPRERATIEVSHTEGKEDGETVYMVRDNGIGFDMKYVDKLFGVFQRLHRPEDFEGTGIGLATVQRIVQKHGGRVWAEGEIDKGATFYFTLGTGTPAGSKTDGAAAGGQ